MIKKIKYFAALILFANVAFAMGGGAYSRYGLGEPIYSYTASKFGLSALGIGYSDAFSINGNNPASWFSINLTRMEASVLFRGSKISDLTKTENAHYTTFNGFALAFPISKDYGVVASMGMIPYSRVEYKVQFNSQSRELGDFVESYSGDGGVSRLYFGSSVKLADWAFGATFNYFVGKIEYHSNLVFPDTSSFRNVGYVLHKNYYGVGFTFGMLTPDLSKILKLKAISDLRFGAVVSFASSIKTDSTISTNNLIGTNQIANGLTTTKIPTRLGAGFSFVLKKNYRVAFDFIQQNWNDYRFAEKQGRFLANSYRAAVGMEYFKPPSKFSTFKEQLRYRVGLSYEKLPFNIGGENITQIAASFGVSVPLGYGNSIDIGITAGSRGKKTSKIFEEKFVGASLSFSLGELWFVRIKR